MALTNTMMLADGGCFPPKSKPASKALGFRVTVPFKEEGKQDSSPQAIRP